MRRALTTIPCWSALERISLILRCARINCPHRLEGRRRRRQPSAANRRGPRYSSAAGRRGRRRRCEIVAGTTREGVAGLQASDETLPNDVIYL
jgi:hypothetical protein